MERSYWMQTDRLLFSSWNEADSPLAVQLWGDPLVTNFICASGRFTAEEIENRLAAEIKNEKQFHVQYWPCFQAETKELVGCCGLRPHQGDGYELGFHLRPQFWGQGYATEAAQAVISHAFTTLHAAVLFAGHHPHNKASQKVLQKLGFTYLEDEFYAPTGLYHPSYQLLNPSPSR